MNFEGSFYDVFKDSFYECFSRTQCMLQTTNMGYKKALIRKNDIIDKYPIVDKIFYRREATAISKEECEAIIFFINEQEKIKEIEDEALFFKGGHEAYIYFKKIDILKDK